MQNKNKNKINYNKMKKTTEISPRSYTLKKRKMANKGVKIQG
jgi:hypothetical protein